VVRSYDAATTFLTSESFSCAAWGKTDFYANTDFEYDTAGNVNKITDPNSFSMSLTYTLSAR
jgi:YD repeat-containing protein